MFQNTNKKDGYLIGSIGIKDAAADGLLSRQWLLTNSRGGFSSSTVSGCNTSRYHGLLTGSLYPPVDRIMALSGCIETVRCGEKTFNISTFEFNGETISDGLRFLKSFRRDIGVHFDYRLEKIKLTKSIYLLHDSDTVAVVYDFQSIAGPLEFSLRPLVGLRDFHSLQKSYAQLYSTAFGDGILIRHNVLQSCELFLRCPGMEFMADPQWWYNFTYLSDRQRGQGFTEDLWTAGEFECQVKSPTKIILWANISSRCRLEQILPLDIDKVREQLLGNQKEIIAPAKKDERLKKLYLAADQFIVKRQSNHHATTTILAGFPWFADWGRDALISLPGLLLETGRYDTAKSVLTTFASVADGGMIPNCFDDRGGEAHFNSVDASLWFVNAAFQYLKTTGDRKTFTQSLLPVIHEIIESYHKQARFGIHADSDGLITAGSPYTQLTWMDAKHDGIAFTPRHGKAVEVNALWYNCLRWMADFYSGNDTAKSYKDMAEAVSDSFRRLFWNGKYLNDCILPDGSADASIRPNQIFAVSLPFSPLTEQMQKCVVDVVQKELLTPYGLRTLNAADSRYHSRYEGSASQRDRGYHQGTVWPYLIGPFVEAYLKVNAFSKESKKDAAGFIEPLLKHLTDDACIGSVSEIFDADPPHTPRGCIAQAWSVAELIRAYRLINGNAANH